MDEAGFKELKIHNEWELELSQGYYVCPYPSVCFVFKSAKKPSFNNRLKVVAAHIDQPCLTIKPNPEMIVEGYVKLNTEIYGSPILNTWFDRPLSIAGKVVLRSEDVFKPKIEYVDIEKSIMTIPNLAIHMNKEVNNGVKINKQEDLLPLVALINKQLENDNYFINYIANMLNVDVAEILDFELFVYIDEKGKIIGMNDDFISAPRLDDLSMVHAALTAMITSIPDSGINCIALFDNEEIGSRTKQGADSSLFNWVLEKIADSYYFNKSSYYRALLSNSLIISADLAHALHPNNINKHDPTNHPILGNGVVIKMSALQKYSTDSEAIGIFQQICDKAGIYYQKFVNHSNEVGGKTLGSILSSHLPIKCIDVGIPCLAMHSARELIAVEDHYNIFEVFKIFYKI